MTTALFICVHSPALRSEDVSNLGALAEVAASAGHQPCLLLVEAASDAKLSVPKVFGRVIRMALPEGCGDGAAVLDAVAAPVVAELRPDLILAMSDIASRSWAARLSAALSAVFLPACEGLAVENGGLVASEPVMGGMMRRTVALADVHAVVLYAGEGIAYAGGLSEVEGSLVQAAIGQGPKLVSRTPLPDTSGIPLKGAARVVAGGLGIGSAENWSRIDAFAQRVGAAVGASRAAVDMGWVPSSRQVGFSGQKVAPDIYVAVGISGAVHHLAGIGGARKVVAVNKDPEAPIFQIADVAIVGDYQAILDAAHRKLDQA